MTKVTHLNATNDPVVKCIKATNIKFSRLEREITCDIILVRGFQIADLMQLMTKLLGKKMKPFSCDTNTTSCLSRGIEMYDDTLGEILSNGNQQRGRLCHTITRQEDLCRWPAEAREYYIMHGLKFIS